MVKLGSSIIYMIGNKDDEEPEPEWEESEGEEDPCPNSVACLNDACWIDLSENNPEWRSAPCPTHNTVLFHCVPLSGKIYALGLSGFIPEVYNHPQNNEDEGGCWVELPPSPTDFKFVSFSPIPDPQYDRIIAHINNSAIYSFKPNDKNNQWKRLSPPDDTFVYWDKPSAIVDGVVYMAHGGHIQCIGAYDLADTTHPLVVEWSNSTYPDHMTWVEFDAMLDLGNGFLCLAVYTPLYPHHSTRVYFVLVSFKRQAPHLVTFTYHYFHSYDLADTISVLDFVALGE